MSKHRKDRPLTPAESRQVARAIARVNRERAAGIREAAKISRLITALEDRLAKFLTRHVPAHSSTCPLCGTDDTANPESFVAQVVAVRAVLYSVGRAFVRDAEALADKTPATGCDR